MKHVLRQVLELVSCDLDKNEDVQEEGQHSQDVVEADGFGEIAFVFNCQRGQTCFENMSSNYWVYQT